jgi:hypothetical protein
MKKKRVTIGLAVSIDKFGRKIVLNPASKRWVLKDGKIGQKLLAEISKKTCSQK